MNTPKYIRTGKTIKNVEDDTSKSFKSINKAKKESTRLQQMADGGKLGCGSLVVYV